MPRQLSLEVGSGIGNTSEASRHLRAFFVWRQDRRWISGNRLVAWEWQSRRMSPIAPPVTIHLRCLASAAARVPAALHRFAHCVAERPWLKNLASLHHDALAEEAAR